MSDERSILFLPTGPRAGEVKVFTNPTIDAEALRNWWYQSATSSHRFDGWINDNTRRKVHTVPMSEMTREELDAKMEATHAKVEARLSAFEFTVKEAVSAIRQDSAEARSELRIMHAELSSLKNVKSSIWGAAGATILGIVGLSTAVMGVGVSSYDTGRENTALAQEAKVQITESKRAVEEALKTLSVQSALNQQQAEENRKLLEQVKVRLEPPSK